ncbi:MAG: hypothetical protein H6711_26180 [Myxococcales bacterium]|nr:hypothetical protein [Myxococcales bacterium]
MSTPRILAPLALALSLVAAGPGCASRYKADAEAPTYAAQAKISVKVNKTGIRQLRVEMIHLAPPSKIDPANKVYMVWISVPGQGTTKAGYLDYNERRRRGVLQATTPHPKFEVFVTIEQNPRAVEPSGKEIVRKLVSKI